MKRSILILAVLVAAVLSVGVGVARADRANPLPNCGSSNSNFGVAALWAHYGDHGVANWTVSWAEYCGVGGTVTVEMQHSSDNGLHWYDMGGMTDDVFVQQQGGQGESRVHNYYNTTYYCMGGSNQYRLHVWANPNATTGGPYYHMDDVTP